MIPSSGFVGVPTKVPPVYHPLPEPYRARYYKEGGAAAPAVGATYPGEPPVVLRQGEYFAETLVGLTAEGEPTSYVEIRQEAAYGAALVDQAELIRMGALCDLELVIYAPDGSELVVVGNSVFHEFPFLALGREFESTSVDFLKGTTRIGQFNARILDKRRDPLDRTSGFFTEAISRFGADGISGFRYALRRFTSVGWLSVITGIVHRVRLNDSAVSYTLELRDENQKTAASRAFVTSNASLVPGGPVDPWGTGIQSDGTGFPIYTIPINHALYLTANTAAADMEDAGFRFTEHWSKGLFDPTSVVPDWLIMTPEKYAAGEGEFLFTHDPGDGSSPIHFWHFPKIQVAWWRAGDVSPRLNPVPVQGSSAWSPDGPAPNWWDQHDQVREARNSEGLEVEAIARFYVTPPGMDDVSAYPELSQSDVGWGDSGYVSATDSGENVPMQIRYLGETSEEFPFFVERPAAEFVKAYLDGEYGGFAEPIRYDAAAIDAIRGVAYFMLEEPVDDPNGWLAKNVWAPLGLAPTLDGTGALSPVSNTLPSDPTSKPQISGANSLFPGSWEQSIERIVNTVVFRYWRLFADQSEPHGVGMREVTVKLFNRASVERHGERKAEFSTVVFSAYGWAVDGGLLGGGPPGDNIYPLEDETGQIMAAERYSTTRARYAVGPQNASFLLARSAFPDLRAGDWFRVAHDWLPNLTTGYRGASLIAQAESVADDSCGFWRVEVEGVEIGIPTPSAQILGLSAPDEAGSMSGTWILTNAAGSRYGFAEAPLGTAPDSALVTEWFEGPETTARFTPSTTEDRRVMLFVEPWKSLPSGGGGNAAGAIAAGIRDLPPAEPYFIATADESDSGVCDSGGSTAATKRIRLTLGNAVGNPGFTLQHTGTSAGGAVEWSAPVDAAEIVYEEAVPGMVDDGTGSQDAHFRIIRDSDSAIVATTYAAGVSWNFVPCEFL